MQEARLCKLDVSSEFSGMPSCVPMSQSHLRIHQMGERFEDACCREDSSQGLKQKFFGPDGKESLNLQSFSKFIEGAFRHLLRA